LKKRAYENLKKGALIFYISTPDKAFPVLKIPKTPYMGVATSPELHWLG
jgi:hypothetical protein